MSQKNPDWPFFVIHDSIGFNSEPGGVSNFKAVVEFSTQRLQPGLPLSERVHVLWYVNFYCNPALPYDEQHRCMGLNSHGISKVSVIDAAGVKQVEHK